MSLEALELKFEKLSGSVANSASTASSGIYQPEGYLNDNIHPVQLRYRVSQGADLSLNVAPNLFSDVTTLTIESERDQSTDISIIDISGRVVSQKSTTVSKGTNTYTLQRTYFENAGIYVIGLSNSTISRWARIVLID